MKQLSLLLLCLLTSTLLFGQQRAMKGKSNPNVLISTQVAYFEEFILAKEASEAQVGLLLSIPFAQLDFQWSSDRNLYIADAELMFGLVDAQSIQSKGKENRWWDNQKKSGEDMLKDTPIDTTLTITLSTESLATIQDSVHTQGIVWTLPSTYLSNSYAVSAMLYSGDKQRPLRSTPSALSDKQSVVYPVIEQGEFYCAQFIRPALAFNTDARLLWLTASLGNTEENLTSEAQFFTVSDYALLDREKGKPSASSAQSLLPALEVSSQPMSVIDQTAFALGRLCVPNQDGLVSDTFDGKSLPNETLAIRIGDDRFTWQSVWTDMPRSLRNIDIAIQTLEFIEEDDIVNQMMKGSASDKKTSFFDFWTPKDPTEGTHYNELMVEFYRRVDQAAQEFSSPSLELLDSDQAKVFIRYGEPDSKTREFPPGGKTQEVWRYGQTKFLFEASSGFGDFVLVSPNSL
tara:strand:+ start:2219 stop:3595 length:1377 start_codon:yes stop_codon:yes gene_type:complete